MRSLYFLFFVLFTSLVSAQQFSVLVRDQVSKAPIPYATVQFEEGKGIITNEEGVFGFDPARVTVDSLKVSCMGYVEKTLPTSLFNAKEVTIDLERNTITLNDVKVYATFPNIDSIMSRVRRNLTKNYPKNPIKQKIFLRKTESVDFKNLGLDLEKSTLMSKKQLAEANKEIKGFADQFTAKPINQYTDLLIDRYWKDSSKIKVTKATYLFDANKTIDTEVIQERGQELILRHLDTTKSYKVKTGLFKVEDSLKIGADAFEENEEEKDLWTTSYLRDETDGVLTDFKIKEDSFLKKLIDPKYYDFYLEDQLAAYGEQTLFVVRFEPRKRKAKYAGTFYINDEDFAIVRADYDYAEGRQGKKVNLKFLLGVRFAENLHRGAIFFKKHPEGGYKPHYAKRESGQYVYVKRPFKFIENTEERNKLKCELLMEMNVREKNELIILEDAALSEETFVGFSEEEKFKVETLQQYDPNTWEEYQALSPVNDMKTFGSED